MNLSAPHRVKLQLLLFLVLDPKPAYVQMQCCCAPLHELESGLFVSLAPRCLCLLLLRITKILPANQDGHPPRRLNPELILQPTTAARVQVSENPR